MPDTIFVQTSLLHSELVIVLAYARSGGTLLNKCLASNPNNVVLSEVNPLGGGWGQRKENSFTTPGEQAYHWYGIRLLNSGFLESIIELNEICQQNGKNLIIRDWSFVNFSPHALNEYEPPNKFLTYELLKDCQPKVIGYVRNSVDVWLSRGRKNLTSFATEYDCFIKTLFSTTTSIYKYEDLTREPVEFINKLHLACNLGSYQLNETQALAQSNVNGDTQLGKQSRAYNLNKIKSLPRRSINKKEIKELILNGKLLSLNRLMGYSNFDVYKRWLF